MKRLAAIVALLVLSGAAGLRGQGGRFTVRLDAIVSPSSEFTDVHQLIPLDSTRAIAVDERSFDLTLLTAGAQSHQPIGRHGSGPGEYRQGLRFGEHHDSAWVVDDGKFALIPMDGHAGITIDPQVQRVAKSPEQTVALWALMTGHHALALLRYFPELQIDERHRTATVLISDTNPTGWKVITSLRGSGPLNIQLVPERPAGPTRSEGYENPFYATDVAVRRPDGSGFQVFRQPTDATGKPIDLAVTWYNQYGAAIGTRHFDLPRLGDEKARADRARSVLLERMAKSPLKVSRAGIVKQLDQQLGRYLTLPAFAAPPLIGENVLWLKRFTVEGEPEEWSRVALNTSQVSEVDIPPGCSFQGERQGRIWLSCHEADVPVVRRGWLAAK
jgi:hypothetical protein